MTMNRPTLIAWLFLAALWVAGSAAAAEEIELPQTANPLITDGAVPIDTGKFAIQPYWSLSCQRGYFSPSWRPVSARGDFVSLEMPVKFTYGPVKDMEVYLIVPSLQNWGSSFREPGLAGTRSAQFGGLGDLMLALKYRVLAETETWPTVSGLLAVNFPTGHHSHLKAANHGLDALGDGAYNVTLGLNLSKWLRPVYLYANVWYSLATHAIQPVAHQLSGPLLTPSVHQRNLLTVNLAAEWVLSARWVLLLEGYSNWEVGAPYAKNRGRATALVGVMPGVEFLLSRRWALEMGVAVDLGGKSTAYYCTPMVSAIFTY